jgi:hypothetical protein
VSGQTCNSGATLHDCNDDSTTAAVGSTALVEIPAVGLCAGHNRFA